MKSLDLRENGKILAMLNDGGTDEQNLAANKWQTKQDSSDAKQSPLLNFSSLAKPRICCLLFVCQQDSGRVTWARGSAWRFRFPLTCDFTCTWRCLIIAYGRALLHLGGINTLAIIVDLALSALKRAYTCFLSRNGDECCKCRFIDGEGKISVTRKICQR